MGENSEHVMMLGVAKLDGQVFHLEDLPESGDEDLNGVCIRQPPFEMTCEIRLRRMSRKKFIKMLMSVGVTRNHAAAMAKEAWFHSWEYASAFLYYVLTMEVQKDG